MSQFIIKNWAGDDGQVEVFDLRRLDTTRVSPSGIMFVRSDDTGGGIVPPEYAEALEGDWSLIESKAADALDDDPSTLAIDPERRQALLDLMALHLLRSSEMMAVHTRLVARGATRMLHEAQADEEWDRILEDGMSHEEALRSADAVIRHADADIGLVSTQLRTVAERFPEYLDRFCALLRRCGLRLHRPKRVGGFLLGDGPAFLSPTSRLGGETTALFGRIKDVAQSGHLDGDEWRCWMPLTPRLLAVAGSGVLSSADARPLASQNVDRFNAEQCRRAQFRVVLPPDQADRAREFVKLHASRTPAPVSAYPMIEADPYEIWNR